MTASPYDPLAALAAKFLEPHPATLYAGHAIIAYLRHNTDPAARPADMPHLLGLRVVEAPTADPGEWWIHDQHGDEMDRGRVGAPGEQVAYWPGVGFVAINLPAGTLGPTS